MAADSQPPEGLQHDPILELITSAIPVDPVDGTTIVATQTIAGQAVVGPVWGHPSTVAALIRDKLTEAGRLLPSGGEVKTQWAVRWHLVGGGVDEQDCYRNARETAEQRARRLAARPPMGVERGEALMRRIYTGPWSPVLSDNTEGQPQ